MADGDTREINRTSYQYFRENMQFPVSEIMICIFFLQLLLLDKMMYIFRAQAVLVILLN